MADNNLNRAIALSRSGKKSEARELLTEILRVNPQNETAWLWFADTFIDNRNRIAALEECLKSNPNSQAAQKGLEALKAEEAKLTRATQQQTPEIHSGQIAQTKRPVSKPLSTQDLSHKPNTKQSAKNNRPFLFLCSTFGIIILFSICIFYAWILQKQGMFIIPEIKNPFASTPNVCNAQILKDVQNIKTRPNFPGETLRVWSESIFVGAEGAKQETLRWEIQQRNTYGCVIILSGDVNGINIVGMRWFVDLQERKVHPDDTWSQVIIQGLAANDPDLLYEGFPLP